MCIFSGPVERVENTSIFARIMKDGDSVRQCLVYQMKLLAREAVAMVLPVPVRKGGSLEFVDLSGYPDLFDHLYELTGPRSKGRGRGVMSFGAKAPLPVEKVGGFIASFVPAVDDFDRLDPRFRVPEAAIEAVPAYRDFGFAVFQFYARDIKPHPMAFVFDLPEDGGKQIYFPTSHVHDGTFPAEAEFDHSLYFQAHPEVSGLNKRWPLAPSGLPGSVVDLKKARGLVDDAPCYRIPIRGYHANTDTYVAVPDIPYSGLDARLGLFRNDLAALLGKHHEILDGTGLMTGDAADLLTSHLERAVEERTS